MVGVAWVCTAVRGAGRNHKQGVEDGVAGGRLAAAWVCKPDMAVAVGDNSSLEVRAVPVGGVVVEAQWGSCGHQRNLALLVGLARTGVGAGEVAA